MSEHYKKEELELFRNHQMSFLGRMACQAHLNKCSKCADRLKELSEDDDLILQLRAANQIFESIINEDSARETTCHSSKKTKKTQFGTKRERNVDS